MIPMDTRTHDLEVRLDRALPGWRDDYDSAEEAAVDMELIDAEELEADRTGLDFSEEASWRRFTADAWEGD